MKGADYTTAWGLCSQPHSPPQTKGQAALLAPQSAKTRSERRAGMTQSRRNFLAAASSLLASAWTARSLAAQGQVQMPQMPPMPTPTDPFPQQPIGGPMPEHTLSPVERLKMNQAQIKKNMARLKAAVDDLQKEFDSNSPTKVLSMAAVHKTEEIEHLARDIRGLLRG
jgi:hypothetical protein